MKSLPEKEVFNQLESRLRRYTEMPDDDAWDKIAGALPREKGISGWVWFDRLSAVAIIGLLLLLVMNQPGGISNESTSNNITNRDEPNSTNKDNSVADNILIDRDSSSNEKNQIVTKDVLLNDDNATNDVAFVNKRKLSENGESLLHNNNQKPIISKSLRKEMITSASDNSNGKNHPQNIADGKLSDLNNIDGIVTIMSNTISITGNEPSDDLSNASSASNTESVGTQLNDNIDNNRSVNNSGISIDSVNKILVKPEDSLEIERKKRVPKELRKEKKIFKSVLYFTATPTLAYYKLTPDMHDNVTVVGLKQEGIFNTNRLGFNLEAGYQRKLNEKLEVYGGLSYYQQSQQITYYYESAEGSTINTSSSKDLTFTVDPVAPKREKSIDYTMKNIGVSAGLFYLIKEGRLQHKIGGGLQYQKGLARQNADATYSNASSSYFNYLIAYRLEWRYKARTNFFIQPNVNHVIQSKEKLTAPFSVKPYRAGIGVGILYWF